MKNKILFLLVFIFTTTYAGFINDVQKNQQPDAKNPTEESSIDNTDKLEPKTTNDNVTNEVKNDQDSSLESPKNEETSDSTNFIYVFFIYLLVNFLIYKYVPNLRRLTIAPPNEFSIKIKRTDAQELTKHQKFTRLNYALLGFSLFYWICSSFVSNSYLTSFITAFISHVIYLFLSWIMLKKCPKCNSEDSMKVTYDHDTPLGIVFTRPEKKIIKVPHKINNTTSYEDKEVYVDVSYQKIRRDWKEKCAICKEEFNYTETKDEKL